MDQDDRIMSLLAPVTQRIRQLCGEFFPSDYFVLDTETTGFSLDQDLIVEWGHVLVRDQKVVNKINLVINWYDHPTIPKDWLTRRLDTVAKSMRSQGKSYRITPELMQEEGVSPGKAIPWLYDLLDQIYTDEGWVVSHNGVKFDFDMLDSHFRQDLGEQLHINPERVIDTGCIEKASQLLPDTRALMNTGETLQEYFVRMANWRAAGVLWNIHHCYNKYGLDKLYHGDESTLHTAGEDAYVVHLLLEQFRHRLDARASVAPPPQISPSAAVGKRRTRQRNR